MHLFFIFSFKAFTANGKPTIVLLGSGDLIEFPDKLSHYDILQTNAMYECPGIYIYTANTHTFIPD